ncbi:hypothetical protein A2U01_0091557, partial [Trifolium medium]|nr:hypothetical protein [Trifolium medium]
MRGYAVPSVREFMLNRSPAIPADRRFLTRMGYVVPSVRGFMSNRSPVHASLPP